MDQEKTDLAAGSQLDANRHRVRPHGARRVDISPNVDRPAEGFQLRNEVEIPHIPGMKNERRMMPVEKGEEVGMRLPMGIGDHGNDAVPGFRQFNRSGLVPAASDGQFKALFEITLCALLDALCCASQ